MNGKVKWFNNKFGYGFITNENGNDVFVHHSGINCNKRFKKLNPDDVVTFDVEIDERGMGKAINVQLVNE